MKKKRKVKYFKLLHFSHFSFNLTLIQYFGVELLTFKKFIFNEHLELLQKIFQALLSLVNLKVS